MARVFKLSKSRLLAYRQCPKRLWLQTHRPELAEVDAATSAVMANGTEVGEVFRTLRPDGFLIDTDTLADALSITRQALRDKPGTPIFEATFEADDTLVRLDMLAPANRGFRLVEVKSSTSVKHYHLDDAAIQTWVAQRAGIPVNDVAIAHIDNRFIYPGSAHYAGLFAEQSINDEVAQRLPQVIHWIKDAQAMLAGTEPRLEAGAQCHDPFACPFIEYCAPAVDGPEFPVDILPRNHRLVNALKAEGYADLREVPDQRLENELHQKVLRVTKTGQAELDEEGRKFVRELPYPRFHLDFETIAFAVPRWQGTSPYQQVPFQFSCHVELVPGTVVPFAFLSTDGTDPRRPFAEALIKAVSISGLPGLNMANAQTAPILVYNATFERSRIKELAAAFPDLADQLGAINERIVDLLPIARAHYYHPEMRGSWSLKAVLPTIGAGLDYDGMAVANGGMAQDAYLELIAPETPENDREALRQGLLDYCALDTYALVQLAEFFARKS